MTLSKRGCGESISKSREGVEDDHKSNPHFTKTRGSKSESSAVIWKSGLLEVTGRNRITEHNDWVLMDLCVREDGAERCLCRQWVRGYPAKMESSGLPLGSCW